MRKEYYQEHRDKILRQRIEYYWKNREKIMERRKELYQKNKDEINRKRREKYLNDPEYIEKSKQQDKKYYRNNKQKVLKSRKRYYKENREQVDETHKEWAKNNPEKMRKHWLKVYYKKREWGFIALMDNPFPDNIAVDFHHVYPPMPFAIPLPRVVHLNYINDIEKHIAHNKEWFEKLYGIDVVVVLGLKPGVIV